MPSSSPATGRDLAITLATTNALLDQFSASLTPSNHPSTSALNGDPSPPPLPLLCDSAASLKAQSTKLSLLTLTPPFTPSAITTTLKILNESVLPSLVTAALLVTGNEYTTSFSTETASLVRNALLDLESLISCVASRSKDGRPKHDISEQAKAAVTEAVGRVWESCDALVTLAANGVAGFVVRKAEMWLALIKDAVQEIQDWDPENEEDGGGADIFADISSADLEDRDGEAAPPAKADTAASLQAKFTALKTLQRVPQSVHVVIKQRLQKLQRDTLAPTQRGTIDIVLDRLKTVSETIDETAESLYIGDLQGCEELVREVWGMTVEVVDAVIQSWDSCAGETETKEDLYVKRALGWIKQVEPDGKAAANENTSEPATG